MGLTTHMKYKESKSSHLIAKRKAPHPGLNAQDVVVHCEHLLQRGGQGLHVQGHLGVVNTREVAGAGWLVLLWLQGEGVHVDAWVGGARVVHVWLVLVEVLAQLLLEAVLAVQHQLEVLQWADLEGARGWGGALLDPVVLGAHGRVGQQTGGAHGVGGNLDARASDHVGQWVHRHLAVGRSRGEVPHAVLGRGGGVLVAPHQLLHWVVEGQAHRLGGGGDGVTAGVLHLLDQVLVTLLGEAATLLSVQVHVVGPHLEHLGRGAEVVGEARRQVEVQADLVVLQGNQGQVQAWVAVEEEQQGQVHVVLVGGLAGNWGRGQLAVVDLVSLIQEHLRVQTEPRLVVLVDALATDGQLNGGDGTLSHPGRVVAGVVGGQVSHRGGGGLQGHVHVADQVTVAGNGHGHAAAVGGGAVHRLLDVLHRKVGVALVHGLEKGHLGLTSQIHILSTVSNQLH
jgi:hypothetical protein